MRRKGCRREVVLQTVRLRRGVVPPEAWRNAYRVEMARADGLERALHRLVRFLRSENCGDVMRFVDVPPEVERAERALGRTAVQPARRRK